MLETPIQVIDVRNAKGDLLGQTTNYAEASEYIAHVPGTSMTREVHTQSMPSLKPLPSLTQ